MSVYWRSQRRAGLSTAHTGLAPAFAAMVGGGALLSLQARANGELTDRLGSALVAGAVSFAVGAVLLAALVALRPGMRRALGRVRATPGAIAASGAAGAVLIVVTASAAPRIGVSLLTICLVAGMTAGALVFDRLGLAPGGRRPVTTPRLAGALLALTAVIVIGIPNARGGDFQAAVFATVCGAGAAAAFQTAINGRIRDTLDSAAVATLAVFATALGMLLAMLAASALLGDVHALDWPGEPWPYAGGLFGALFVLAAAVTVARLGVLRSTIATLVGQIGTAVVLDTVTPVDAAPVGPATLAGLGLIFAAAVIANLRRQVSGEPGLQVSVGTPAGAE